MAITTETNRTVELTTDGVETEFDFSMLIHADTDIQVWYKATGDDYALLTLDTHYTVAFTEDGGTVTTIGGSSPYAAGTILIIRHLPITQQTNWLYNDDHTEQTHQDDFDRACMRDLQIQEQLDRCVGFAIHSSTSEIEFPEPAADNIIGWNAGGTALENKAGVTGITLLTAADGNFIVGDGTEWIVESGATARDSLGLTIGANVQAWDTQLDDIAALAVADGNFIVGDGTNWVAESGNTARASLGLIIGTNVQAWDAQLDDIAALALTDGNIIVGDGSNWVAESGAVARTSLGLGAGNSPTFTGLTITGNSVFGLNSTVFQPTADSTTFFQVLDADGGIPVLNVDTTNERVGFGVVAPIASIDTAENINIPTTTSTVGQILQNSIRVFHTFGTDNIFIGNNAGNFTTSGTGQNVSIGTNTLDALTTGYRNVAIGFEALTTMQDGANNVAMGRQALKNASSGNDNFALGSQALFASTTASDNIAIGREALLSVQTGAYNVAIGRGSLSSNLSQRNTAIGFQALQINTGEDNVAIGQQAGSNTTSCSDSIFIGRTAGKYEGTNDFRLVFDSQDRASAAGTLINSIIYGIMSSGVASGQSIRFNVGNLSVISATPYQYLINDTHEDSDGGRESQINFKGEQSGGELTTLARIEVSHDGAADDEKGKIILYVNDGDDGDSPTQVLEIGSDKLFTFVGNMLFTGTPNDPTLYFQSVNTGIWFDNSENQLKFAVGGFTDRLIIDGVSGDVDIVNDLTAGTIQADNGFTGSWVNNEGDTVTVVGGVITSVAA